MTPRWHPARELVTGYAAGNLALGPLLAVGIHLDACETCRWAVGELEGAHGKQLASQCGAPLRPGALEHVLSKLDAMDLADQGENKILDTSAIALPASLAQIGFQPAIHLGPETWVAHLDAPRFDGWRTYVFCCPAETALPTHGHLGDELIVVLEGAFHDEVVAEGASHDARDFRIGDFIENRPGLVHDMQASREGRLVALISSGGAIAWRAKDAGLGLLLDI